MTCYQERPSARTGRKVWDAVRSYLDGFDYNFALEEIFFGTRGYWYFTAKQTAADADLYRTIEGRLRSDDLTISAEYTSARGSWDERS